MNSTGVICGALMHIVVDNLIVVDLDVQCSQVVQKELCRGGVISYIIVMQILVVDLSYGCEDLGASDSCTLRGPRRKTLCSPQRPSVLA